MSQPPRGPQPVSTGDLAVQVLRDMGDPDLLQLGVALPNPEMLPLETLSRALVAFARRYRDASAAYDLPPGYEHAPAAGAGRILSHGRLR